MKKCIIIILLLIVFSSCQQPTTETETIIKETTKALSEKATVLNTPIYPLRLAQTSFNLKNFLSKGTLYAGNGNSYVDVDSLTKQTDFIEGTFYYDNSINSTDPIYCGVWRTLDLSAKIGKKTCDVVLYIKVVAYGASGINSQATFKFRTPDMNITPTTISQTYSGEYYITGVVTTDTDGCIEWCYAGNNAYDAITINADPGFHSYQWVKCQIWLWKYATTNIVNE